MFLDVILAPAIIIYTGSENEKSKSKNNNYTVDQ